MTRLPSVLAVFGVVALTVLISGAAIVATPERPQEKTLPARVERLEKQLEAARKLAEMREERLGILEEEASRMARVLDRLRAASAKLESGVDRSVAKGFTKAAITPASREEIISCLRSLARDLAEASKIKASKSR